MRKGLASCLLLLFVIKIVSAQDVEFSILPAAKTVGFDDAFQVTYQIKNAEGVQSFRLEDPKDIQIIGGPAQSNNVSYINGVKTSSVQLTYVFKALKKGNINLPIGIIRLRDKELKSASLSVNVVNGSVRSRQNATPSRSLFDDPFGDDFFGDDPFAVLQKQQQAMMQIMQQNRQAFAPHPTPSSPQSNSTPNEFNKDNISKNLFIKVDVDKTNVCLGEQVTASYKIYTRLPMEINLTKLPSLNGFWSQDFTLPKIPKPTKTIYNGKEYQVFEIKRTALFPTQNGTLELDPAEASGVARVMRVQKTQKQNPFGNDPFFDQFFSSLFMNDPNFNSQMMSDIDYEDVKVALKSTPIKINVRDVPEEKKPESFNGAIGNYTIESNIDKLELTADDVATINIKVSGVGNLKLINPPIIQYPSSFNSIDVQQFDTITNKNDIIAGYKIFKYSFSPQSSGTYEIPATAFSYFDPETKQYKTLSTQAYTLHVKPGKSNNKIAGLPNDIHDINTNSRTINKVAKEYVFSNPIYWGGFAIPILAFIFTFTTVKKEEKLQSNTLLFKNKKANKIALNRLESAEKYLKLSAQNLFYEETAKAVWLYLSDKLSISLSTLSKEVAEQKLSEKNISENLKNELFRITNECEMALYTPDGGCMRMHQTYSDAFKLIGKLEESLS